MNSVDLPVLAAQKSIDAPFVVWIDRDDRINTWNLKLMTGGPLERLLGVISVLRPIESPHWLSTPREVHGLPS